MQALTGTSVPRRYADERMMMCKSVLDKRNGDISGKIATPISHLKIQRLEKKYMIDGRNTKTPDRCTGWKGGHKPTTSTSFANFKQTCRTEPNSIKGTETTKRSHNIPTQVEDFNKEVQVNLNQLDY